MVVGWLRLGSSSSSGSWLGHVVPDLCAHHITGDLVIESVPSPDRTAT
eukprot:COSAG01_NODE_62545_length_284_cov_0.616216_2_plen_47_part_01